MPPDDRRSLETSIPKPNKAPDLSSCPPLTLALVQFLDALQPLRLPDLKVPERELWFTAGRRSIVEYLLTEWNLQNKQKL